MSKVSYAEALSRPRPNSKKPVMRSVEVEKAAEGGHIVTHRFQNSDSPYHEPKPHVFGASEGAKLIAHLKEHLGIKGGDSA